MITTLLVVFVVVVAVLLAAFVVILRQQRAAFDQQREGYEQQLHERMILLEGERDRTDDLIDRFYEKHNQPPSGTDMGERYEQREQRRETALQNARDGRRKTTPMTLAGAQAVMEEEATRAKTAT